MKPDEHLFAWTFAVVLLILAVIASGFVPTDWLRLPVAIAFAIGFICGRYTAWLRWIRERRIGREVHEWLTERR